MSLSSEFVPSPAGQLTRRAQGLGPGAAAAKELLLDMHRPLLLRYARMAPPAMFEDAYQAACEGFLRGLAHFDPDRGFTLGSFVRKFIVGAVSREIRFEATIPWSLNDYDRPADIGVDDPGFHEAEMSDVRITVRRFVHRLPPRRRSIVAAVFFQDRSQAEVARELGVSRAAVHKILEKVFARGRAELAMLSPPTFAA